MIAKSIADGFQKIYDLNNLQRDEEQRRKSEILEKPINPIRVITHREFNPTISRPNSFTAFKPRRKWTTCMPSGRRGKHSNIDGNRRG